MEVSFRAASGWSSRSEIVDWLELRNKREKKERDEMMIGEVCLSRGVGCGPVKVSQPCRWCDAEPRKTLTQSSNHSNAWLCSGGSHVPTTTHNCWPAESFL
jgi:hypothetical protein